MRNLADGNPVGPGARLVLVDVFVTKIERRARLGDRALRCPVAVDGAERRAATRAGGCRAQGRRRARNGEGHATRYSESHLPCLLEVMSTARHHARATDAVGGSWCASGIALTDRRPASAEHYRRQAGGPRAYASRPCDAMIAGATRSDR